MCLSAVAVIYPDPEKVTSLEEADVPKNKNELRSFLGMTNLSSIFIENHFSITAELTKLLYKHAKWEWNDNHQKSLEVLKKRFKGYFDLKLNTEVICDASPYALSAILTQYCEDENKMRVVTYASRSLIATEHKGIVKLTEKLWLYHLVVQRIKFIFCENI